VITIESDRQSQWLAALADPTRRRIVDMLQEGPRPATEIHAAFAIAGPAVSRHLRVLREAGLVSERRVPEDGRVRLYGLEPEPLRALARWLDQTAGGWQRQLDSFQDYVKLRKETP
jgi:DNA-binding transcriptional ArsR family regulator